MTYIIRNVEQDPLHPIGPSVTSVLKTSKQLQDGLASIQATCPVIADQTADTAPAFIGSLFDAATTAIISAVLEGTSSYTANAPTGVTVKPSDMPKRLKYATNPGNSSTTASATQ
jgi:hypothetical protein